MWAPGLFVLAPGAGWAPMYNEAPRLAAMVKAGELPPVGERLYAAEVLAERRRAAVQRLGGRA